MTVRPIIRQFGSKTRVAPQLLSLLPTDSLTWVEVFAGTAALTLAKSPTQHKDEHLNDLNEEIVGLFSILRDPVKRAALCDAVGFTPWSEAEYHKSCIDRVTGDEVENARRFLVRSWQGMAGASVRHTSWIAIDRAKKRRPLVWQDLPERIAIVAKRLQGVALHCQAASRIVERFASYESAILFVDPPYPSQSINSRDCYAVTMSATEHEEFALLLRECRASVLMTMAPGTIYDRVLDDWHRLPLRVRGLRNQVKTETVFLNYDPRRAGLFVEVAAE